MAPRKKVAGLGASTGNLKSKLGDKLGRSYFSIPLSQRSVLYPLPISAIYSADRRVSPTGSLTETTAKAIIGWETESDYRLRLVTENPAISNDSIDASVSQIHWAFIDELGQRVTLWNNTHNRPIDVKHVHRIAQDILTRNYLLNGEAIVIGRTGLVLSGQHRLLALIVACQVYRGVSGNNQSAHWQEISKLPPSIETFVSFGIDESQATIQTIDNNKSRTAADTYYTSDVFSEYKPTAKKELSRILDVCVSTLWQRTRKRGVGDAVYEPSPTFSTLNSYRERHPSIIRAVKFIYEQNLDRRITQCDLSPGVASAVLYLMGTSFSDIDAYNNVSPVTEEVCDLSSWSLAEAFWKDFATDATCVRAARQELISMSSADDSGGRVPEKLVLLAKAWNVYKQGQSVTFDDVSMTSAYRTYKGQKYLVDTTDFGGIDLGPIVRKIPTEDLEAAKRQEEIDRFAARKNEVASKIEEHLRKMREKTSGE